MAWVFFVLGGVVVVAIAFYTVGRMVAQLESERPSAVYELAAASDWIAARLPDEVTARLSYDELGQILGWHLDWFASVGVSWEPVLAPYPSGPGIDELGPVGVTLDGG